MKSKLITVRLKERPDLWEKTVQGYRCSKCNEPVAVSKSSVATLVMRDILIICNDCVSSADVQEVDAIVALPPDADEPPKKKSEH